MRELSLDIINSVSPYRVEYDNATKLYRFVSDYHVGFSVAFEENDLLQSGESYQFALTNYEGKKSPRDNKVRTTVLAIVEEFFSKNEAALLYIYVKLEMVYKRCETDCFIFGLAYIQRMTSICFCHRLFTMKRTMRITQP